MEDGQCFLPGESIYVDVISSHSQSPRLTYRSDICEGRAVGKGFREDSLPLLPHNHENDVIQEQKNTSFGPVGAQREQASLCMEDLKSAMTSTSVRCKKATYGSEMMDCKSVHEAVVTNR